MGAQGGHGYRQQLTPGKDIDDSKPVTWSCSESVKEEVVYDTVSSVPQHIVRSIPPFTNISLRLVLSNPEGRKESEELLVLTDEDGTKDNFKVSVQLAKE